MITAISRDWAGGSPGIVRIVTTDDLDTVKGEGYLASQFDVIDELNKGVFQWVNEDSVLVAASDGSEMFHFENGDFSTLIPNESDGGGGGSPGGSNNNMQYNNNGSFGGDPNFNTDGLGNFVINGSYTVNGITYPTSDGTAGQAIVTDGSGNLSFATVGGGGGSPGGANGQLQFNNSGSFGGTTDITYSTTGGKFLKWDDLPNFRVGYNSVTGGYGTYTQGYNIDNEMYSDSDLVFVGESMLVQYVYNTKFVSNAETHNFHIGSGSISSYDLLFVVTQDAGFTAAGIYTDYIFLRSTGGGGTINIGATSGTKDTVRINGILYPDTDGTAGQVMTTDGDGNLSFATVGGGSPGGSNGELQFNDDGVFGGSPFITCNVSPAGGDITVRSTFDEYLTLSYNGISTGDNNTNVLHILCDYGGISLRSILEHIQLLSDSGNNIILLDGDGTSIEGNLGVTINSNPGQVRIQGFTYPKIDGTAGQVMTTDGAGNLSFQSPYVAGSEDIGGQGAGPINVTIANPDSKTIALATVASSTNPAYVIATSVSGTTLTVTLSADPGANCMLNFLVV